MAKLEHVDLLNTLLSKLGIPVIIHSLDECVPTLWIALFETILECKIPDIDRSLEISQQSRLKNTQLVIDELELCVVKMDLSHIKAYDLINQNPETVRNFIEIFVELSHAIDKQKIIEITGNWNETSFINEKSELLVNADLLNETFPTSQHEIHDSQSSANRKENRKLYKGKGPMQFVQDDIQVYNPKIHPQRETETQILQDVEVAPKKEHLQIPSPLKIKPSDTPHTRALKIRRYKLITDLKQSKNTIKQHISKHDALKKRVNVSFSEKIRGSNSVLLQRPKKNTKFNIDDVENPHEQIKSEKRDLSSTSEVNFKKYSDRISKTLPVSLGKNFNKIETAVHKSQVKTWTKALDDRIWKRKVNNQVKKSLHQNNLEEELQQKDIIKANDINQKKKQKLQQLKAKSELQERIRQAVRMEFRKQNVHAQIENLKKKREFQEEKMVKDLLGNYVKSQRDLIIEERKFERDELKAQNERLKYFKESKENFYKDQVDMLKEEYSEAKRTEQIVIKAHEEESRKIIREKKEEAKKKIGLVKEKLAVDASNLAFQELTAEELKKTLKFKFR